MGLQIEDPLRGYPILRKHIVVHIPHLLLVGLVVLCEVFLNVLVVLFVRELDIFEHKGCHRELKLVGFLHLLLDLRAELWQVRSSLLLPREVVAVEILARVSYNPSNVRIRELR